jgi:hypothetical protein
MPRYHLGTTHYEYEQQNIGESRWLRGAFYKTKVTDYDKAMELLVSISVCWPEGTKFRLVMIRENSDKVII